MKTAPRTIMIRRHAETPDEKASTPIPCGVDEHGQAQPISLIPRGWPRAGALAAIFRKTSCSSPAVLPTLLVAPASADVLTHRPHETFTPLARKLNLQHPVATEQDALLVSSTLLRQTGQDVLSCGEQHPSPALVTALVAALGVTTMPAHGHRWPDDDFASVLVFSGQPDGVCPLTQTTLSLLDGDYGTRRPRVVC